MGKKWQLQDAKNRFSEVVEEALHHGPQTVTRHGEETVIVLSIKDYWKLSGRPKESFAEFMMKSPLRGVELDLKRNKSLPRDGSPSRRHWRHALSRNLLRLRPNRGQCSA